MENYLLISNGLKDMAAKSLGLCFKLENDLFPSAGFGKTDVHDKDSLEV